MCLYSHPATQSDNTLANSWLYRVYFWICLFPGDNTNQTTMKSSGYFSSLRICQEQFFWSLKLECRQQCSLISVNHVQHRGTTQGRPLSVSIFLSSCDSRDKAKVKRQWKQSTLIMFSACVQTCPQLYANASLMRLMYDKREKTAFKSNKIYLKHAT